MHGSRIQQVGAFDIGRKLAECTEESRVLSRLRLWQVSTAE